MHQEQQSYDYRNQMNTAVADDVHLSHQDCKHILLQFPGAVVAAAVGAVEVRKRTFPLNAENVDVNPCHEIHGPSQTLGSSAVDWKLTAGAAADHDHHGYSCCVVDHDQIGSLVNVASALVMIDDHKLDPFCTSQGSRRDLVRTWSTWMKNPLVIHDQHEKKTVHY